MTRPGEKSNAKPTKKPKPYKVPEIEGLFLFVKGGIMYGHGGYSVHPECWSRMLETRKKYGGQNHSRLQIFKLVEVDHKGKEVSSG